MNGVLERILKTLEAKGMTEYQLCKQAGISSSTFSTWKAKDRAPDTLRMPSIAKTLGVSLNYLLTGEDDNNEGYYLDPEAAAIAQELYERPELKVLFKASRNVAPEDIKVVQEVLDALARKDE